MLVGGLSHFALYNQHPPLTGFDRRNFQVVVSGACWGVHELSGQVSGIVIAIKRAYFNLRDCELRMATGKVVGASLNRSPEAYLANPSSERAQYTEDVDSIMQLLRIDGTDGVPVRVLTLCNHIGHTEMAGVLLLNLQVGMINWFAVHPTSMGSKCLHVTGAIIYITG